MIYNVVTKEKPVNSSYKDMQNLEFHILLYENHYANLNSIHLCFPIKICTDLRAVNHFFAYWIKELNITKYGDNFQILSTNNPFETYRYSDSMLKHLPKD